MNLSGSVKINKCGMLILSICGILLFYYLIFSNSNWSRRRRPYAFILRNPDEINMRKLLIGGIQAAQMGGLEVLQASNDIHSKSKGQTKEGANDPVTNADLRSHCVMENGLKRLFSKVTIISEEDSQMSQCNDVNHFELDPTVIDEDISLPDDYLISADDVTVWIDPLDATQEYTESLFQYVTTMVCVAIRGEPVIGIIHNPFTLKTVWAWKDVAVSESLRKIQDEPIARMAAVKNPKVIVSRSHSGDVKKMVHTVFGEKTPITVAAGAGYKVLEVVFGNVTNYIHMTEIKKWDICAGHAILSALQGQMTSLRMEPIRYDKNPETFIHKSGVIATLRNHQYYGGKIYDYFQQMDLMKKAKP